MPDMHVIVRWPDDSVMRCYSPSLVIRDYLAVGAVYAVAEFVDRSRTALRIGSDRIRAKYGYPCSRAARSLARIEAKARVFPQTPDVAVRIEAYHDA